METSEILRSLDLDGITDLPTELGALDPETLCVNFNFSRDQYVQSRNSFIQGSELPENLKTYIHELTHLFQITTTPVGIFFNRARVLQSWFVMQATRVIISSGYMPKFPLVSVIGKLSGKYTEEFLMYIRLWYAAELVILFLMGETLTYNTHYLKNRLMENKSLAELFNIIQWWSNKHHEFIRSVSPPEYLSNINIPNEYTSENFDVIKEDKVIALYSAIDLFGGNMNILSVLESASTVAENYGSLVDLNSWKQQIKNSKWAHTIAPKSSLLLQIDNIRANNIQEFVLAYTAICDTALHSPILYEQAGLRNHCINFEQLLPFKRWWSLANAASTINPPTSVSDYGRYCDALCEKADLQKMSEVNSFSARTGQLVPMNVYEEIYWKSQYIRAKNPGFFTNFPFFIYGGDPQSMKLKMDFEFPVIQYSDRTFFLKDRAKLHLILTNSLSRIATRHMMLGNKIKLKLPFDATSDEKIFFRNEISMILTKALGFDISNYITMQ